VRRQENNSYSFQTVPIWGSVPEFKHTVVAPGSTLLGPINVSAVTIYGKETMAICYETFEQLDVEPANYLAGKPNVKPQVIHQA
jgi:hypothetical protein